MVEWYYLKYVALEVMAPESHCFHPPLWAYILRQVSSLLMTLDASSGFLIYCVACKQFRKELKSLFQNIWLTLKDIFVQKVGVCFY
jgi:hypothetical protein